MSFDLFTWLSLHEAWSLFQNSLKPLYSETVSDSAVPCYNQIHISKLVSQPSYTIRNSSSEVGRRVSGHESGNARRELLGSLSLSHEVDGVAQCYWLRASLWMLINKLMVPLIYFNHFFVIFKTAMNNPETPIQLFKQGSNMTRFLFSQNSKGYSYRSVGNEFEMSWEWESRKSN